MPNDTEKISEILNGHKYDCDWHCDQHEPDCNGGGETKLPVSHRQPKKRKSARLGEPPTGRESSYGGL